MDKEIDNRSIVLKLKTIMNEKKWSKKRLAEEAGVSVKTFARWEKNENEPTDDKLEQIAKATGYTYDWLADLMDEPKYAKDEWLFYNKDRDWGLRGLNGLYERINTVLKSENISEEQLITKANLDLTDSKNCKNWHFIGDNPSLENILKICTTFNYNEEWLWNNKGKPKKTCQSTNNDMSKSYQPPPGDAIALELGESSTQLGAQQQEFRDQVRARLNIFAQWIEEEYGTTTMDIEAGFNLLETGCPNFKEWKNRKIYEKIAAKEKKQTGTDS